MTHELTILKINDIHSYLESFIKIVGIVIIAKYELFIKIQKELTNIIGF